MLWRMKRLELEVLQHEVGDERVVRDRRRADLIAVGGVGLELVEILGGDQRFAADGLLPEHQQRQQRAAAR